ncbi:PA14 domain-containing protein, partial [uncultured Tenacibaculum sp.]|uniref:PA14 domain-containing protein n=1 Tax=uncultured Tenacibaculum sp. TaxID=174713 RepID=UPI002614BB0D
MRKNYPDTSKNGPLFFVFLFFLLVNSTFGQTQTITKSYSGPTVSIDGTTTTLPGITFLASDFPGNCNIVIEDVNVSITWTKTDGSCAFPNGGNSFHGETRFSISAPSGGTEVLAPLNTWSGGANIGTVTTIFDDSAVGAPSGTPVTGTFLPDGSLSNYIGNSPLGTWNLIGQDSAGQDPLCVESYSVSITVTIVDTDSDGVADFCDLDDDNDGILDTVENNCVGSVSYEFYDSYPATDTVDDIPTSGALATGTISNFNVDNLWGTHTPGDDERFSVRYKAFITINTSGLYTFYTTSDDGSKLFVDGTEVVDNDGPHGSRTRSGQINLNVGVYEFEVLFYERTGAESLSVEYQGPSISRQTIPFSQLSCFLDTDNDGVPNYLDTDSDNDGCFDAVEGDENVDITNLSSGRITGGVDANGVPLYVNSGGAGDVGGDQGQGLGTSATSNTNAVPNLVITNPAAVCSPATVDITASAITAGSTPAAGGTYTYWTNATATNVLASPNAITTSGTYYIKLESVTGCYEIEPVVVTVNSNPGAAVNTTANGAICEDDTKTLVGSPVGGTWSIVSG